MYLQRDCPMGIRFLAAVKDGGGLKPSARAAGVGKKADPVLPRRSTYRRTAVTTPNHPESPAMSEWPAWPSIASWTCKSCSTRSRSAKVSVSIIMNGAVLLIPGPLHRRRRRTRCRAGTTAVERLNQ